MDKMVARHRGIDQRPVAYVRCGSGSWGWPSRDEPVSLVGFGTFERKRRNKRIARYPRKPMTPIVVPARDLPWFTAGKEFREMVASKRRRVPAKR